MKRGRVVVLAIAATAALTAAWMANSIVSRPPEVKQVEKTVGATDVLVAAKDINLGDSVRANDFKWQQWPVEGITPGLITKSSQPDAPSELSGAVARAPFISGEPIKDQKLIKISEGGVMAAILPRGMRAVSTPIREETAAGGFILPNDRVDVILSHKRQVGRKEETVSEAVLRNVRVLAIGQALENSDGEKVVAGKTATLELTPRQAEVLTLAQSIGEISLSLRSLSDAQADNEATITIGDDGSSTVKLLKYGVPSHAFGVN
ncbi:MAG: Flp pilus assembly protein CpaB [Methyloceanibacter sp.]|uniref:Flp pilus assembly protein CpaB n=1 Tax=Methyloceanibacter sp. TaxID=1965321 RepID=UPI001D580DC4|nr:Flp pilus assembly protein CpaB [Methyloceanibacter sp.]MCB1441966.1 Flp pilus assembly protein CpaB [Methyloceanibacter sp.]MCC0059089.1 Flp pilus assembly protein CpaB [Hyphomicrobiaceae bacterium]